MKCLDMPWGETSALVCIEDENSSDVMPTTFPKDAVRELYVTLKINIT